jgi:integration host factor subunit beta
MISVLREKPALSKSEAATVVDHIFDSMADVLFWGDRVEIRGLCSFMSRITKATPAGIRKPARK